MSFTDEELEDMRRYDEEVEKDFRAGHIKGDAFVESLLDGAKVERNAKRREYVAKNRDKLNAYQREYRAKQKELNPDKYNEYSRRYRAKIKAEFRDKKEPPQQL